MNAPIGTQVKLRNGNHIYDQLLKMPGGKYPVLCTAREVFDTSSFIFTRVKSDQDWSIDEDGRKNAQFRVPLQEIFGSFCFIFTRVRSDQDWIIAALCGPCVPSHHSPTLTEFTIIFAAFVGKTYFPLYNSFSQRRKDAHCYFIAIFMASFLTGSIL